MATLTEVAARLKVTLSYASGLVRRGIITKQPRGGYDVEQADTEYRTHLRRGAAGRSDDSALSRERARLAKEQADGQAMRNEVERGLLVERAEVIRQVTTEYATLRDRLLGVPGKLADCLDAKQRERVETEIVEALNELSDPAGGGSGKRSEAGATEGAETATTA